MAHIVLRPSPDRPPVVELFINGVDFSQEVYRDIELVEVGDGEWAEVGLRVTFAVSRLDLGGDQDLQVTDQLRSVAQRVRSMAEVDD